MANSESSNPAAIGLTSPKDEHEYPANVPGYLPACESYGLEHQLSTEQEKQRAVLKRLKEWYDWDEARHKSLKCAISSQLGLSRRPALPDESELYSLAQHFFTPRSKLRATICDFEPDKVNLFLPCRRVEFDVDPHKYFDDMPDRPNWVSVRWIHVPCGPGAFASAFEEAFLDRAQEEASRELEEDFGKADIFSSTYEILNFRERQDLQDQLDVFNILRSFKGLTKKLDKSNWYDEPGSHISWLIRKYEIQRRKQLGFWESVESDLPWQLTGGIRGDSHDPLVSQTSELDDQILSHHPSFADTVLVRDYFRCCSRRDGMALLSIIGSNSQR